MCDHLPSVRIPSSDDSPAPNRSDPIFLSSNYKSFPGQNVSPQNSPQNYSGKSLTQNYFSSSQHSSAHTFLTQNNSSQSSSAQNSLTQNSSAHTSLTQNSSAQNYLTQNYSYLSPWPRKQSEGSVAKSSSCASSYTDYFMDSFLGTAAAGGGTGMDITDERELAHRLAIPYCFSI
ncbi:uncharacterized protein LOC113472608 isoform X2 [Diaphorina citri]|uniref:Uncharacterized protein LOC113472608 isoform X1 n=1 Tax=Diaphorina citri TaxID=121845 RepID=A0A3Q0JN38_DIACI|nr:uncharacterized protein LOC113472608 isoform X1 [Diaphorina citri]XP_026688201.1 uncharacterized protein LOC113472608 isoform X2 [Diaphorina citri]